MAGNRAPTGPDDGAAGTNRGDLADTDETPPRTESVNIPRLHIRCPNCLKDGSARGELINQRITCKHCAHVFRAISVDGQSPIVAPPAVNDPVLDRMAGPVRDTSKPRIEALEEEVRQLKASLADRPTAPASTNGHHSDERVSTLTDQLAKAIDDARRAHAARREADDAREAREQAHNAETRGYLDRLAVARSAAETAKAEVAEIQHAQAAQAGSFADQITKAKDEALRIVQAKEAEARSIADQLAQAKAESARIGQSKDDEARSLADQLAQVRAEMADRVAQAAEAAHQAEAGRVEQEAQAAEARAELVREVAELREQLETTVLSLSEAQRDRIREEDLIALRDDLARARAAVESEKQTAHQAAESLAALQADKDSEHARVVTELQSQVEHARHEIQAAEDRNRLGATDRAEAERARAEAAEHDIRDVRDALEAARAERHQIESSRIAEIDAIAADRDRAAAEVEALKVRLAEADSLAARLMVEAEEKEHIVSDWGYASTETEIPKATDDATLLAQQEEARALRDELDRWKSEAESLRADLARKDVELANLAFSMESESESHLPEHDDDTEAELALSAMAQERFQAEEARRLAELDALKKSLADANAAAEAALISNQELASRVVALSSAPTAKADPAVLQKAVDEAVKGAWADFERRLAETQSKLKAANARAEMLESEAREAREQISALEKGFDPGEGSSFDDPNAMVTSFRIMADRGSPRLTLPVAEARLELAKRLAVDRKDKPLIDRISRIEEKVRADLEARNHTLADTLVRGAEIEVGLDPGGWSIKGLKFYRSSQAIVTSLAAMAPAFERAMRQGDLEPIKSTIVEMRTILGDQAGLPEIRRPGRFPAVKLPIAPEDAARLFGTALEAETALMRPILANRPLTETTLSTYATLIEACVDARNPASKLSEDDVDRLNRVVKAACLMLTRRQQQDGHFPFLDPRGKTSKLAKVVDAMVAARPDSVKDGWVVAADSAGMAQLETAACGVALAKAGQAFDNANWKTASLLAADWALTQPCLPLFPANAASTSLLARAYRDGRQDRHLKGLVTRLTVGLLPGQIETGRWIDPVAAETSSHIQILRSLHDAWDATPADRAELRSQIFLAIDRAFASLLDECAVLGVPANGGALRDLIRHRELFFPSKNAPRLEAAILDSATVIQELCHDGAKVRFGPGICPDQVAALTRL